MIKTRVGTAYELIDLATRENGGVPPMIEGFNVPLTRENWDKIQAEIREKFDDLVKEARELHLLDHSPKIYNC